MAEGAESGSAREKLKDLLAKSGTGGSTETFSIQVIGYENDDSGQPAIVVGKRLNGAEVRVALRADTKTDRRPEVADMAKPLNGRNKYAVAAGGSLRVDSAYMRGGVYQARWLSRIAPTADTGYAIEAMVRVGAPMQKANGTGVWRTADILTGEILRPENTAELLRMAKACAGGPGLGLVRMSIDAEPPRAWNVTAGKDGDVERTNAFVDMRKVLLDSGLQPDTPWPEGVKVEVLPARRMFFGPEGATNSRLDSFVQKSDTSGKEYSKGFTMAVVSVIKADNGYEFVGDVAAVQYEPKFTKLGPETDSHPAAQLAPKEAELATAGPAGAAEAEGRHDLDDDLPDFDLGAIAPGQIAPASGPRFGRK